MGAFTHLIKNLAMKKLRADTLSVADFSSIAKSPKVPRLNIAIDSMSEMGKTARFRATLEGERRWCGNTGETLTGGAVQMGKHEKLCMLLDKRTLGCHHVDASVRKEAMAIFEEEYVKFALCAKKYQQEQIAAQKDTEVAVKIEGAGSSVGALASGDLYSSTLWSDDDDDDQVQEVEAEVQALEEARRVLKNWKKYSVDWYALYPNLKKTDKDGEQIQPPLDLTEDLMTLPIGKLYKQIEAMDTGRSQFGWIPTMASSSVGQLGALSAEWYCERVLSCANNVITKGNTLLDDDELEMLVILRMNRDFMQFMREHYNAEAKQAFGQTVVRDE